MTNIRNHIYTFLMDDILSGKIKIKGQLPTEKDLANKFNTNRMNARFCINILKDHGIVYSNKKGGTYLLRAPGNTLKRKLDGLFSNNVFIVASLKTGKPYHWNELTLSSLCNELKRCNLNPIIRKLPKLVKRTELQSLLKDMCSEGFSALIFLPRSGEHQILENNADLIFNYSSDNVYMHSPGIAPIVESPFNIVTMDHFQEGVMAAEYLVRKGIEKIFYLDTNRLRTWWGKCRLNGIMYGTARESENSLYPEIIPVSGTIFTGILRDKHGNNGKKSAYVLPTLEVAIEFLQQVKSIGLKVPEDLNILAFGELPELKKYKITRIVPDYAETGLIIAQLITGRNGKSFSNTGSIIKVKSIFVEGETCSGF